MSGQQIGSFVGGVVGSFFGPMGYVIGSAIGGAIGGYIDPTVIKGPRLTNATQQTANDGVPIPWGHGTYPTAGNIIWTSELRERKKEDDGKGSGTVQVTYHYYRSYAIAVCQGMRQPDETYLPIAGILIVKRNGKVVYDVRGDIDDEQVIQNAKFMGQTQLYLGSETQDPDSVIESHLGVGNTPAYPGIVYMVRENEELTELAGAIPQYEFVVSTEGESVLRPAKYRAPYYPRFRNSHDPIADPENLYSLRYIRQDGVAIPHPPNMSEYQSVGSVAGAIAATADFYSSVEGQAPRNPENYLGWRSDDSGGGAGSLDIFGPQPDNTHVRSVLLTYSDYVPVFFRDGWSQSCSLNPLVAGDPSDGWICGSHGDLGRRVSDGVPRQGYPGGTCLDGTHNERIEPLRIEFVRNAIAPSFVPPGGQYIPDAPGYYVMPDGSVHSLSYELVSGNFLALSAEIINTSEVQHVYERYTLDPMAEVGSPTATEEFWTGAYNGAVSRGLLPEGMTFDQTGEGNRDTFPRKISSAYVDIGPQNLLDRGLIPIAAIVSDACDRSGLSTSDYDVSQLTDLVDGYKVATEATGESIIAPLMSGFFFDAGEWDDRVRFVKRGGNVVAELNGDDLCESDGDVIEETEFQEVELLRKVHVKTVDPSSGFIVTTQTAERRTSNVKAKGEQTIEIPVVTDKDTQARMADKRLKVAWSETRRFAICIPYTIPGLTVTDIVGLTDNKGRRQRVRLMEMAEDSGRIEIKEAMLDRQSSYTSNVEGTTHASPTGTSQGLIGPSNGWVANLPSLRTSDNVPGVYLAASGYLRGWGGCVVLLSVDAQESYQQVITFTDDSVMGVLTAPCTESSEPLRVFMNSGSLSSVTAGQIALGQNAFAISTDGVSELGQFRTATPQSGGGYHLTDTIRGGRGTVPASHDETDQFVMVATAKFLPLDISLAGKKLYFKFVSFGTSQDDANAVSFVFSPKFTNIKVSELTVGGNSITVLDQPIYVVT